MQTLRNDDYFEAGLELLGVGGAADVTVDNLCTRLHVTKGSFYHHFDNRPTYVRELIEYWETRYSRRIGESALDVADPRERIRLLAQLAIGLNHEAENAIRTLARSEAYVREIQDRLDAARESMLARTMIEIGLEPAAARNLAQTSVAAMIGLQQLQHPVDRARMRAVFDDLERLIDARLDDARAAASSVGTASSASTASSAGIALGEGAPLRQ